MRVRLAIQAVRSTAIAAITLLMVAWLASYRWGVIAVGSGWFVAADHGGVFVFRRMSSTVRSTSIKSITCESAAKIARQRDLMPTLHGTAYEVPPWAPPVVCAMALVMLTWPSLRRRDAPLACPSCSYDLRGLTTGVCPECGEGAMR